MLARHLLLTAGLVLAAGGRADADTAVPASHPAYCTKLSLIAQNWRTVCTKASRVRCDGHSPGDRRAEVVRRLGNAAKLAASSGRGDVAEALRLSSEWVAAGTSATTAYRAHQAHLGERLTLAGRKADRTIRTDCGFAPYPRPVKD